MTASRREIVELWQRAQEALRATGTLLAAGFPDFAAARAYYAAFYAASALLLAEGKTFRSHRGVMALMHRDYIKPGRLPLDIGRMLSTLSDLRSIGDYGGAAHVSHTEAAVALSEAQQVLEAIQSLLPAEIVAVVSDREAEPDRGEQERS
ncbi:MAG: HEPN domain-containing protein [Nitrospinae bacterium]|nr:HEPN domain-containing protein [Nitrospinota bacterium]